MSQWGTLDAHFTPGSIGPQKHDVERDMPTGSESGPAIHESNGGFWVEGRLRDVNDHDSPTVLAWFLRACAWANSADLTWDLDDGPKYRYEWDGSRLSKLRGVLD